MSSVEESREVTGAHLSVYIDPLFKIVSGALQSRQWKSSAQIGQMPKKD